MEDFNKNKSVDGRLEDCLDFKDLQDAFTLKELVVLTQDGLLEKWLRERLFESQAETLSNIRGLNSDTVLLTLCDTLNIDVTRLSDYETGQVTRALQRERENNKRKRECGIDGKIVTNQSELAEALADEDTHKIYLYDETFSIPLNRGHITYDGRGNALINILAKDTTLDFDANEVYFYNLTIVFHFLEPRQVKIDHSSQNHNNIVFLHENRITKDDSIQHYELAEFLSGRKSFEAAYEFAEKAAKFHDVIVGKAYLNDYDYDLWHETFFLNPVWRVEFIESLRRYTFGASLYFRITPEEAKELFYRERAQLVYADFGTDKDDAVIIALYLQDNNGKIYPILCLKSIDLCAFGSGSGSGATGYGIELIEVDRKKRMKQVKVNSFWESVKNSY